MKFKIVELFSNQKLSVKYVGECLKFLIGWSLKPQQVLIKQQFIKNLSKFIILTENILT